MVSQRCLYFPRQSYRDIPQTRPRSPLTTNSVANLDIRVEGVLSNSNNMANPLVSWYQRQRELLEPPISLPDVKVRMTAPRILYLDETFAGR